MDTTIWTFQLERRSSVAHLIEMNVKRIPGLRLDQSSKQLLWTDARVIRVVLAPS